MVTIINRFYKRIIIIIIIIITIIENKNRRKLLLYWYYFFLFVLEFKKEGKTPSLYIFLIFYYKIIEKKTLIDA